MNHNIKMLLVKKFRMIIFTIKKVRAKNVFLRIFKFEIWSRQKKTRPYSD